MKLGTENINLFQLMAALLLTPCYCICSSFQIYSSYIASYCFFVQLQTFGTKSENYLPSILLRGHP